MIKDTNSSTFTRQTVEKYQRFVVSRIIHSYSTFAVSTISSFVVSVVSIFLQIFSDTRLTTPAVIPDAVRLFIFRAITPTRVNL